MGVSCMALSLPSGSFGPLHPDTVLNVLDRADLNTPRHQFGSSGLDVPHDQRQAWREPGADVTEHAEPGVSWTFRLEAYRAGSDEPCALQEVRESPAGRRTRAGA
jgi:hypothetical protein